MNTTASRCRIRPAREQDLSALSDLLDCLFAIEEDFQPDRIKQRKGLTALLNRPDAIIFVAEVKGQTVGMISCQTLISTAEGGEVGLVEDVVISPAFRKQGIGQALVDAVVEWAKQRRLKRLQLLADSENAPALTFYRQLGWQQTQLQAWRRLL